LEEPLIDRKIKKFIKNFKLLEGFLYKDDVNNAQEGFDCSWLIIYLYNTLDCRWFRIDCFLVNGIFSG